LNECEIENEKETVEEKGKIWERRSDRKSIPQILLTLRELKERTKLQLRAMSFCDDGSVGKRCFLVLSAICLLSFIVTV
jgi:hypothetical protein